MKKTYKMGAHKVKLVLKPVLTQFKRLCGYCEWESKTIYVRTTDCDTGQPYALPSALTTFFHEIGHAIDRMQGHALFEDTDDEVNKLKESALDSFTEALVFIMLENKLLNQDWLDDWQAILDNTEPVEIKENDDA